MPDLIVLAASRHRAKIVAERHGATAIWPTGLSDLKGLDKTPVVADWTLWGHGRAEDLAVYFAARLIAADGGTPISETLRHYVARRDSKQLD